MPILLHATIKYNTGMKTYLGNFFLLRCFLCMYHRIVFDIHRDGTKEDGRGQPMLWHKGCFKLQNKVNIFMNVENQRILNAFVKFMIFPGIVTENETWNYFEIWKCLNDCFKLLYKIFLVNILLDSVTEKIEMW